MNHDHGSLLVVDDSEANRDLLCRRLAHKGYTTTAATGGRQALERVGAQRFDLVLLDIMMPDLDGLSVLKTLRQTYSASELPIIMVTAKQESADIVEALELGANDYVTKPIDFPVVLARVRTQLSHKRAEAALRESEERYALAMQGASDGLWDWNLATSEIYVSPRWKATLGIAEHEDISKPDAWFSLVHPEDRARLHADIAAHCQGRTPHFENEHRLLYTDGTYRWMLSRGVAVRDAEGRAYRMAGSLTDITERKVTDGLTGLPNRLLFMDRLRQAITHAQRRPNYLFAVLFLDIVRFKIINDSLGPAMGDQLLIAVAQRLEHGLRRGDTVIRLGTSHTVARLASDKFIILLDDLTDVSDATRIAERLQRELAAPFVIDTHEMYLSSRLGIALSTTGYERPEDVLRDAELALHRAKARGTVSYEVFDTGMHARAMARLQVETDLRRAVESQGFCVYYQPIVTLSTGRIGGFEALIRWQHPERGLVSPGEFIPVAEETGLILPVGAWVLQEACRQMRLWQNQFPTDSPLFISVNLSGKQFAQPDLIDQIVGTLQETGLAASSVKLEITESVLMDNPTAITPICEQLRALGVHLSLDDFGTGYSSLSYLHRFPLDTLKIDRSFVSRMDTDSEGHAIVQTIITLAHQLGMDVVAEGIESAQHLLRLRELGCEYGQGYFVSKPLDADMAETLLAAGLQW
jgi:diguanylate cyclase (GGDEF)-like protein/PAS domain S-box-containing protein